MSIDVKPYSINQSVMSKTDEIGLLFGQKAYDILALMEIKPKYGALPQLNDMHIPGYDRFTSDLTAADTRGVCNAR